MRDGGEVMELQPIVTIPKMDWLPIEVVFVAVFLLSVSFSGTKMGLFIRYFSL
ncbi:hypothetical protein [Bacillus thuringiensis]|uniref:hypothetical protein n=1 Tax=Bacillus thuringiensis TaxID=1428 RepID=UPI0015CF5AD6|nr:hypothetical protein [Bacillus thuringiensis]EKS8366689.1 hypothetical protein [Bacillus cereus]EKS8371526.1 hypothetical protein [Bacillus cereus]MED3391707.1 hypothetical protein [Bacillus thuringiensis]